MVAVVAVVVVVVAVVVVAVVVAVAGKCVNRYRRPVVRPISTTPLEENRASHLVAYKAQVRDIKANQIALEGHRDIWNNT